MSQSPAFFLAVNLIYKLSLRFLVGESWCPLTAKKSSIDDICRFLFHSSHFIKAFNRQFLTCTGSLPMKLNHPVTRTAIVIDQKCRKHLSVLTYKNIHSFSTLADMISPIKISIWSSVLVVKSSSDFVSIGFNVSDASVA